MTLPTDDILRFLPELRRYASALTGSTRSGDEYIRVALEALVEEPWRLRPGSEVKLELHELFHRALQICRFQELAAPMALEASADVQRRLMQLSLLNLKLLLLVDLEDVPVSSAAELLRLTEDEAEWRLACGAPRFGGFRRAGGRSPTNPALDIHRSRDRSTIRNGKCQRSGCLSTDGGRRYRGERLLGRGRTTGRAD